jgi:hypothetical protein
MYTAGRATRVPTRRKPDGHAIVDCDQTAFECGAIDTVVERTSRRWTACPSRPLPPAPCATLLVITIPVLLSLSLD